MENQLAKQKQNLPKSSTGRLWLNETFKQPIDLLSCERIGSQIEKAGFDRVHMEVTKYVSAVAMALGVECEMDRRKFLAKELIEMNQGGSIEDIRMALQKGRRGEYPMGFAKRNHLGLELLASWMKAHQEYKASLEEYQRKMALAEMTEKERIEVEQIYERMKNSITVPSKINSMRLGGFADEEYLKYKKEYEEKKATADQHNSTGEGNETTGNSDSEGNQLPSEPSRPGKDSERIRESGGGFGKMDKSKETF